MDFSEGPYQRIDEPLYNTRVIRNYVEYVRKFHPLVDLDSILAHAWITTYELEDQGHWFSQWQVDRFHERLVKDTGDREISRKVGRYVASSEAAGALKHYAMGFMSPAAAYWVVEKIAPHLTRASTVKTRKLKTNKFEVSVTPKPGTTQKPYQCENLMGQLEALSKLFTNKFAKIDHPQCIHKGRSVCVYVITFEKTPSFIWRGSRNYFILLGLLVCLGLLLADPFFSWLSALLLFATLYMGISYYFERMDNTELARNIESQREAAKLLLDQINIRYNDTQLVKEIGQATSMLLDIRKLVDGVIRAMRKRLDYDRGGIWLANRGRSQLVYTVGYGYSEEVEGVLRETNFRLDNPRSKGVAIQAFRQQRPFLVNDTTKIERDLSTKSLDFLKKTGTQSFICVPLVYEGESLGVLFVDNLQSKRPLSQSDMSLLMGIATQIAISIHNAMSYQKLQESKEREQSLRKLFEKYVPAPIIKRYVDTNDVDLLKGEESSITVLFLDIRGFTSSSETMDATDVVSFLNSYFERCSFVVFEGRGHINKYTGDGFLAIFGAPEPLENHAAQAFTTACKLLELTRDFILAGQPMGVGIGIYAGRAVLGNIGCQTKIEYTAIGDTVNSAARLQEFTRHFNEYPIIMGREVWENLNDHPYYPAIRHLGSLKVRGKKEGVDAYGFNFFKDGSAGAGSHEEGLTPLQRIKGV
ncbi:MAG: GAF domain-containing protein [Deltaproteobacteria bacterium]|nr:GAF domain-containing protein [Deltaproteobacteria bacterium]